MADDKRALDAKKRQQWERRVTFGERMKERRARDERIPQWQRSAHPAYPVVYDILRMDGLTTEDLDKPLLGIANSNSDTPRWPRATFTFGHWPTPPRRGSGRWVVSRWSSGPVPLATPSATPIRPTADSRPEGPCME